MSEAVATGMTKRLIVRNGQWFGLLEEVSGWRTWARITSTKTTPEMKDVLGCYRLAYYYFQAGILGKLVRVGVRENGADGESVSFQTGDKADEAIS